MHVAKSRNRFATKCGALVLVIRIIWNYRDNECGGKKKCRKKDEEKEEREREETISTVIFVRLKAFLDEQRKKKKT